MDKSKEQGFSNCSALNEEQSRLALTLLKRAFEEKMHLLISDDVFLEIFKQTFDPDVPKTYHMIGTMRGVSRPISTQGSLSKAGYDLPLPFPHLPGRDNKVMLARSFFSTEYNRRPNKYWRLVIHTPHAGTQVPFELICCQSQVPNTIAAKSKLLIDHHTDSLFAFDDVDPIESLGKTHSILSILQEERVVQVSSKICRVLCDVERLENDPLEEKGLGISYDLSKVIGDSYHKIDKRWAMYFYQMHQAELKNAIEQPYRYPKRTFCNVYREPPMQNHLPLLLDCHSFSEQNNAICPNASAYKDIDICIGFNDDSTKPDDSTIYYVADFFRRNGYNVEYNKPFSNSKTVDTDMPYHSLMIEVNKHCYMNEDTLEKTEGFEKLHSDLQKLYHLLLN